MLQHGGATANTTRGECSDLVPSEGSICIGRGKTVTIPSLRPRHSGEKKSAPSEGCLSVRAGKHSQGIEPCASKRYPKSEDQSPTICPPVRPSAHCQAARLSCTSVVHHALGASFIACCSFDVRDVGNMLPSDAPAGSSKRTQNTAKKRL